MKKILRESSRNDTRRTKRFRWNLPQIVGNFSADLEQFDQYYRKLTEQVRESGESFELGEDYMVIGTSALAGYEIDGAVNIYAGCYNNPFLIWGKYRKKWLRATLPVSFQFHHTQLDGIPAAEFLERLQRKIQKL